jgi:histidinol-phosphate aminotransferase
MFRSSRRNFIRLAGLSAAALPVLTEAHFAHAASLGVSPARRAALTEMPAPDAVLINANENPLGPSAGALRAIDSIARKGGRYDIDDTAGQLTNTFARQNNLKPEFVNVYAGSSDPLHFTVLCYTSPTKSFVTADPCYEAGMFAADIAKAKTVKVALRADYSHDVRAMVAADPNAGVIYICNPNNPTGTLTAREDIEYALAHKPKGSILLVDEAYIHLSSAPSVVDLAANGGDLIVLRTFSKVYGMAGIRCGLAIGRPDLLEKLRMYGVNSVPVTAMAAANASLLDPTLVPERKKIIADTRNQTFEFLRANNYKFIPSESNCFMIDTGRNGKSVIAAMKAQNVWIGRTWPIWPNHVRITVGTPAEMAKFQTAFKQVMDAPATAYVNEAPLKSSRLPLFS